VTSHAVPRLERDDLLIQAALVDGCWVGEASIAVFNPATEAPIGRVPNLGSEETRLAVAAAFATQPLWRAASAYERADALRRWHRSIQQHGEDLARILTAEQGKPLAEARAEIGYAASFVEWYAEEALRVYGYSIPGATPSRRIDVLRQPVGVVAAVTPWNFPAAMVTRKLAPALAVGCTVVLKPSELTPFTALALARLAMEAGIPAGAINVVTGAPGPIGEVLTTDARIRKFTFTGSTPVGKRLAAMCQSTVKRTSLELGGNAPFIVFADADLDAAVAGAVQSKFRNAGQTCVCANRLLVHESVIDQFAHRLAEAADGMTMGDGATEGIQQGPLINPAAVEKVRDHVQDAIASGARPVTRARDLPGRGYFHAPTVLMDVTPAMRLFREETFGPVAGITTFQSDEEAVRLANDTRAGLAAYFFTRDLDRARHVSEALEYGMVGLNTGAVSMAAAPFGGVKESGTGREGGQAGLDDYLDLKMVATELANPPKWLAHTGATE
jgi:succinate-semialdehyde dehydrogenase/glutarate-semialdehyde dehydrogenase